MWSKHPVESSENALYASLAVSRCLSLVHRRPPGTSNVSLAAISPPSTNRLDVCGPAASLGTPENYRNPRGRRCPATIEWILQLSGKCDRRAYIIGLYYCYSCCESTSFWYGTITATFTRALVGFFYAIHPQFSVAKSRIPTHRGASSGGSTVTLSPRSYTGLLIVRASQTIYSLTPRTLLGDTSCVCMVTLWGCWKLYKEYKTQMSIRR
jgi:hypothetical protein